MLLCLDTVISNHPADYSNSLIDFFTNLPADYSNSLFDFFTEAASNSGRRSIGQTRAENNERVRQKNKLYDRKSVTSAQSIVSSE